MHVFCLICYDLICFCLFVLQFQSMEELLEVLVMANRDEVSRNCYIYITETNNTNKSSQFKDLGLPVIGFSVKAQLKSNDLNFFFGFIL